jgi:hypothetical protein
VRAQERGVDAAGAVLDEVLSGLGWALSRSMAPTMSGPRSVAFHVTSVSDREATYLGIALIFSMYGLPVTGAQSVRSRS